jgi:hypothetical protein
VAFECNGSYTCSSVFRINADPHFLHAHFYYFLYLVVYQNRAIQNTTLDTLGQILVSKFQAKWYE